MTTPSGRTGRGGGCKWMEAEALSLDSVRARIDAIDGQLLQLLDQRADLARAVARAKAAESAGSARPFGLRPDREAQVLRRLLAVPRTAASAALIVRVWRELMGESLRRQGPFRLAVWGGRNPGRTVELARLRFGAAPPLVMVESAEAAVAAAREPGGVGVLALDGAPWWGRLMAEPRVRVFAALPCLNLWGPQVALAVANVPIEPSGADDTFWVTDASGRIAVVEQGLSELGLAAELKAEGGGLRLFQLAGYVQPHDERLARAPGRLTGVIGAAPQPFDA